MVLKTPHSLKMISELGLGYTFFAFIANFHSSLFFTSLYPSVESTKA